MVPSPPWTADRVEGSFSGQVLSFDQTEAKWKWRGEGAKPGPLWEPSICAPQNKNPGKEVELNYNYTFFYFIFNMYGHRKIKMYPVLDKCVTNYVLLIA